ASSSWFCDGCTATTVLVIMRPFRPRHTGADQAAYTLTATVPSRILTRARQGGSQSSSQHMMAWRV
ncbi:hypothetical protein OSI89_15520, partial [Mycobacterium ulcerans]